MNQDARNAKGKIARSINRARTLWAYVSTGIWSDPRRTWWLKVLRTVNLSVQSFLNRDIQTRACAMTYRTLLALVPALALLLAIGRGFGFQNVLQEELMEIFPAQRRAISIMLNFVDSYLSQASGGIFVGIGILFLVWTLISLLDSVEVSFNFIWGQKEGRSIWRKVSDYTAMLLILPILMICASGINLMLSSTLKTIFNFSFMTPVVSGILEGVSCLMTWAFFAAVYLLVPKAPVKIANACVSGAIAGTGYMVLQWLFVTGTLYVTRYNAIYGSFAFLPLLLLWLQLVWVIILAGAIICYSSQNVFAYNLNNEINNISPDYRSKVTLAVAALLAQRFQAGKPAVTPHWLMETYELPARLVSDTTDRLVAAGILCRVLMDGNKDVTGLQLATNPAQLTVGSLFRRLNGMGASGFIPGFSDNFPGIEKAYSALTDDTGQLPDDTPLCSLKIKYPDSEKTDRTTLK